MYESLYFIYNTKTDSLKTQEIVELDVCVCVGGGAGSSKMKCDIKGIGASKKQ